MFHLFRFTETKRASDADISSIIIFMPIVAVNEILEPKSPSTVRVHIDMMAVADCQESLDYLLEHVKKKWIGRIGECNFGTEGACQCSGIKRTVIKLIGEESNFPSGRSSGICDGNKQIQLISASRFQFTQYQHLFYLTTRPIPVSSQDKSSLYCL